MKIAFSKPFQRDYQRLPDSIQRQINEQIERLLEDSRHPSLRVKKMEGHHAVWEARVTGGYRMTFQIDGDTFLLRRVGSHDVLKKP